MSDFDLNKGYNRYVNDVINGKIIVCKNILLACKRYYDWFSRDDIYFDYEDVDRKIRFVSRLRHWEGAAAGNKFILLPWQEWVFANIFGWKQKSTRTRVIENVLIFVARKNGKSSLCAALALATAICDNEAAPQIGIYANAGHQAQILFNMCSKYAKTIDPDKRIFTRFRTEIRIPFNDGKIMCKSSDVKTTDGANYHVFIQDEVHFQRDNELYDGLKSSQQSRKQPLGIQITTAGTLTTGYPLYEYRRQCISILEGTIQDDTQFAALYELDEDDDWKDEKCWIKANPSLGETVILQKLRNEVNRAKNNPALEFGVRTKNFNQFLQSDNIWIQEKFIYAVTEDVDLQKLANEYCWVGVDLSSVSDLTSWSVLFPPNPKRSYYPDKFIFKTWLYVPGSELENSVNEMLYRKWIKQKNLFTTPGPTIDTKVVLKDQIDELSKFSCWGLFCDKWQAKYYIIDAREAGLNIQEFAQGLQNFNSPTKLFEILIKGGRMILDNNEAVRWCLNNCELAEDHNQNVKPVKTGGVPTKKIDAVISMIEALGGWMQSSQFNPKVTAI